jgi:hypothetical protein
MQRKINKTKIKRGTTPYILLCFAKSKKTTFTAKQASFVLAGKMRYQKDVVQAAKSLVLNGYLEECGPLNQCQFSWSITPKGLQALKVLVPPRE